MHIASEEAGVLIGVGRDQRAGSTALVGVKVSTFDVQNIRQPSQISALSVMGRTSSEYVYSQIASDHKSFLYAPKPRSLIAFPITINDYNAPASEFAGALVLEVADDWALREKGRISHGDPRYIDSLKYTWAYKSNTQVKRQLFINELFYTVSNNVIEAHQISDLRRRLRVVVGQRNATLDAEEVFLY